MTNYCCGFQTINSKLFMKKKNRENASCMLFLNKMSGAVLLCALIILFSLLSFPANVMAQSTKAVKGKVIARSGEALPGVTIIVKGTTTGTVTDIEGNYTLTVANPNSILVYSFIGFKSIEIAAANQTVINVTLEESTLQVDEVVAIGYGSAKKRDLTGAVASVKTERLENEKPQSVQDILRGNIAGLSVGFSSLAKGGGDLEIRGDNTLKTGSSPLIVLDGVIYQGGMEDINPNDIETIDVLKDASSSAVYGARAANGVVIVTTKRENRESR